MNWGSILFQAKSAMKKPSRAKEVERLTQNYIINGGRLANGNTRLPISQVGKAFINILKQKILQRAGEDHSAGQLGQTAVDAVSDVSSSTPYQKGKNYYIDINFNGAKHRESLAPETFSGIDNIVALLNNGYDAAKQIRGVWQGHTSDGEFYFSLTHREGAHFIQDAIREFKELYGDKYGVIEIEPFIINEEYEDN